MFLLSIFSYFGRGGGGTNTGTATNTSQTAVETGVALAKGQITSYGEEIVVQPWTSEMNAVFNKLKSNGQAEYINAAGGQGVIILSKGTNVTAVRNELLKYPVDVSATATVTVNGNVNFTLKSGAQKQLFVSTDRILIDPITPVGTELQLDILADISDAGILRTRTTVKTTQKEISLEGTVKCSDDYKLDGFVGWEKRDVNLTKLQQDLNITNGSVFYTLADVVDFSRTLNETEFAAVKNLNALIVLKAVPEGILVPPNLVIKEIVEQSLEPALSNITNVTLKYPPSAISLAVSGNGTYDLAKQKLAELSFTNISMQQGCTIDIGSVVTIEGQNYVVGSSQRQLNYFLSQSNIKDKVSFFGVATMVGNTLVDFTFGGFK